MNKPRFMGIFMPIMFAPDAGGQGGGGGAVALTPEEAQAKLLEKVKATVDEQVKTRNFKNGEEINALIATALGGLSIEALRSYEEDKGKIEQSVLNIASTIDKLKNRSVAERSGDFEGIRTAIDAKMDKVADVMRSGEGSIAINFRAAAIMTTTNTVDNADVPDDILDSFSIAEFVPKRRPREYVFDIADRRTVSELDKYITWLEEGGEEGAFAIVAEGGLKPLISMALVRNVSTARKVAGKYVYTEEFAKFKKEAFRIVQTLIRDKILRDYAAILTTDLLAAAASYVGSALDGQYANPTDYHAIGAVAAQIEALDFVPDVLILNPQDKWRIGLSQDTVGQFYLTIPMMNPNGETTMMGFSVRTSNRVPVGTFILGESGLWKIVDEALTIRMGYGLTVIKNEAGTAVTDVEGDLDHNRFRVIVETFFHNYIATNNAGSFVVAQFDTVKAALQSTPEA